MGRFGGKIFRNSSIDQRFNGGTIGYGAVFDEILFENIFSHLSMFFPYKFFMGATRWVFSIRE
jgi:hypothetical protein